MPPVTPHMSRMPIPGEHLPGPVVCIQSLSIVMTYKLLFACPLLFYACLAGRQALSSRHGRTPHSLARGMAIARTVYTCTMSVYISACMSGRMSVRISACMSGRMSVHMSVCTSICMAARMSIRMSAHMDLSIEISMLGSA